MFMRVPLKVNITENWSAASKRKVAQDLHCSGKEYYDDCIYVGTLLVFV